jgi:hypothetical protein
MTSIEMTKGATVAGRIVAFEDYQEQDFYTKAPKVYEKSGDPVMGVRITLEQTPGDAESRIALWAHGKLMLTAIRQAVRAAGARDLELGADLAVTFTSYQGRAKAYQAAYTRPEAV